MLMSMLMRRYSDLRVSAASERSLGGAHRLFGAEVVLPRRRYVITFEGFSLPVTSLDRSVPFYELLGFATEIRTEQFALLRLGTGTLGLLELGQAVARADRASRTLRGFVQVELSTDDLDGLFAEVIARGIVVHVAPRDRGFERQMQLRDPDGFTVEFAEGPRGHNRTR
jgi:catechol 2,3-dioxygenase-like lactoylglutathione lyase family enzyme